VCSEVEHIVSDFEPVDTLSPAVGVDDTAGASGVAGIAVAGIAEVSDAAGGAAAVGADVGIAADIACLGLCESVPKTAVAQVAETARSVDSCPRAAACSSSAAVGRPVEVFVARRPRSFATQTMLAQRPPAE